jgi:hypothetical protein
MRLPTNTEEIRRLQRERKEYESKPDPILENFNLRLELIDNGLCPDCKQPMLQKQVGKCVYASPCGHRLFQGRAKTI